MTTPFDPDPTYATVTQTISRQTVYAKLYEIYATLGIDTSRWVNGYVMDGLTIGCSVLIAQFSTLVAEVAKSQYFDKASQDWARLKAFYDYGVSYLQASPASGQVTLSNASAVLVTRAANVVQVAHAITKKVYIVSQAVSIPASGSQLVTVRAFESGTNSNAAAGTVTVMATAITGVTVNNAAAIIGRDDESTQELVIRSRESVGLLSPNNARGAYAALMKKTVRIDGTLIGVTRARGLADGFGNVALYVANAAGPITNPTDLATLQTAAHTVVEPEGVRVTVQSAAQQNVPINVTAYVDGSVPNLDVETAIANVIVAFASLQPIGGTVISGIGYIFYSALNDQLFTADPSIKRLIFTTPTADVVIASFAYPTFTPITINVLPIT